MTDLPTAPLADCGAPEGGAAYWLRTSDGVRIRLAHWANGQPGHRHVLICPGRTEYIEKYGLVVAELAQRGWGALVIDWRGQGLSDRLLDDPLIGHVAGDFSDYQRDLDAVMSACETLAPGPKPWLVHSMGGCIGLRGMMRGLPCTAAAFSAPMLGLNQPAPLLTMLSGLGAILRPFGLDQRYAPTTGPEYGIPTMTEADNNLTQDPQQFARMKAQIAQDPRLGLGGPSLRWMSRAISEMRDLAAMPSPQFPALFGLGSEEDIVSPRAIRDRVAKWPQAELADYTGARHEIVMELPHIRSDFIDRMVAMFERAAD